MGLLGKLFGRGSGKDDDPKIRAQYKNYKYFKKQLALWEYFIKENNENDVKYKEEHGDVTPFHHRSTGSLYNCMADCMYSMGDSVENIRPVFLTAIDLFAKGWAENFSGMAELVEIAAKSVLLDIPDEYFDKVKEFMHKTYDSSKIKNMWKPDSLTFFLIGEETERKSQVPAFEKLYKITRLPKEKAEPKIKAYLEGWYKMHSDAPWYDAHIRNLRYRGYWAWEVAAVVKLMGLDDESFKDNPYYPYDLVHYKDQVAL